MQRLLRDRPSQLAIGLFVATFVHSLLAIREVDIGGPGQPGQVPGVAVLVAFVLAGACIAVLVVYVHHIGQALRVSSLVELAGGQARRLLYKMYPESGPPSAEATNPAVVLAKKSGVITTIGYGQLVDAAQEAECVLELIPAVGEFVPAGAILFQVRGDPRQLNRRRVDNGVILRPERSLDQDVAYGLRLLVDMAERSLSDSRWQDPTTAVQAIDRLHDCLRQLVGRPFPPGTHCDADGKLRLIERVMTWEGYVHLAFDEIRLAGAGSPQVARRLQAALRDLLSVAPPDRREALEEQLSLLSNSSAETLTEVLDIEAARTPDPLGVGGPPQRADGTVG